MEITRGKKNKALKVCVYGPEGIGKSTFASQFPEPLFIDTEGSTDHMDVARLPNPSSWTYLLEEINYVIQNPAYCKTLVIDTADWAESMCIEYICAKNHWSGIEDAGYGRGYIYLAEEFGRMLNKCNELIDRGINVVFTAHAQMRKFEQPDEMGAYDRWELKLQKKTAPLLKEWSDLLLFANYKTIVVNVDNKGAVKGKNKAQGGHRIMYATHHSCWDAKNRHGLPDEMPFTFENIAHIFPKTDTPSKVMQEVKPADEINAIVKEETKIDILKMPEEEYTGPEIIEPEYDGIPQKLLDLMYKDKVTPAEIKAVVARKGYYPESTPIANYDPGFIEGVLVGAWKQVYESVQQEKYLTF